MTINHNLEGMMLRLAAAIEHNNRLISFSLPKFLTVQECLERYKLSEKQFKLVCEMHQVNVIKSGRTNRVSIQDVLRLDVVLNNVSNVANVDRRVRRFNPVQEPGQ